MEFYLDYDAFCNESGLINNAQTKNRFVATGTTFKQNMKYNIYYDPSSNGYQNHKYIGIYTNKAVRGIGEIICSADIDYDYQNNVLKVHSTQIGKLTDEQKDNIILVIKEAHIEFGYNIEINHRFFFVDKFYETNFIKSSKNGMMGKRYYDLLSICAYDQQT